MNSSKIIIGALAAFLVGSAWADYTVKMPSFRPQLRGCELGKWTMDYDAALALGKEEGKCTIVLVTGSWWCPHCEALEEKVLASDAWKGLIGDQGYCLVALDFPYRGHVKDAEIQKSRHPELGDGWGFQCWLYDEDYLAENALSEEDGFREIQKLYELQKKLASPTASQVTIKTWDGLQDFTYGKVGYPTIIVYLPDGTEAGRFTPIVTYMEDLAEAQNYVLDQLDAIISGALDAQCGLCEDPDAGGLTGESACDYLGWLSSADGYVCGTVSVHASKINKTKGTIRTSASVTLKGKKTKVSGTVTNGFEAVTLFKSKKDVTRNVATIKLGDYGLRGTYVDAEGVAYDVNGARDVFKSTKSADAAAMERMAGVEQGNWSVVLQPTNEPSVFTRGYGTFSVAVKSRGRATIKGCLGDGTAFSASGTVIAGHDGISCLPVVASLYVKKSGGFGCNIWFKNGKIFNITGISPWHRVIRGGDDVFVGWRPIFSPCSGCGDIPDEMELAVIGLSAGDLVKGLPLVSGYEDEFVEVNKQTWKGSDVSRFKARCDLNTGILKGSSVLTVLDGEKPRRHSAKFQGVIVNGNAYGTLVVPKDGTYPVKITSCDACSD